jgi:hypothetical protein
MTGEKCLATFTSIHNVLKAEETLAEDNIWCDIMPLPRNISTSCGMGLVFFYKDLDKIKFTSDNSGIKNIYKIENGAYTELNQELNIFEGKSHGSPPA